MNQKLKAILGSVLIGGMLLTAGGAVLADTSTSDASGNLKTAIGAPGKMMRGRMGGPMGMGIFGPMDRGDKTGIKGNMEDVAKSLVEQGIITQETADKMTAYMEEKAAERKAEMDKMKDMTEEERKAYLEEKKASRTEGKKDFLTEMVQAGILTQEQADAIKAYLEEQAQAKRQEQQKERLDNLVSQGLITQEQEQKIMEYYKAQEEERKAEMEKIKSMTEEERKAYFEEKKSSNSSAKPDHMQELVEAGILTQDEADAINKYYEEQMKAKMEEAQAKRQQEIESQLDSLVSAGTITQEQKEKILAYLNEKEEARKAEMEKVKNMTEEERKAYMEQKRESTPKKGEAIGPLQELVDNGTLTADQAEAVSKALFQAKHGPGLDEKENSTTSSN
ncbi:MAG: hypothetical protein NUV45_08070 [Tepidanaerobacteraceae bacterium]|nr:hypothetical protein [Tepidanaerobacteraceae bacterium]